MIDRTSVPTDEDALVDCAKADARAFAPLYDRYRGPIYRYCVNHLGSHEDAADATSEVFVKALVGLHRYRSGSFRCWLFTIARHVAVDACRHRHAHPSVDDVDPLADPEPTPEEMALRAEERRWLHGILAELLPGERAALALHACGLSTTETADALGRSPAAIKQLKFRATARLRRLVRRPDNASEDSYH